MKKKANRCGRNPAIEYMTQKYRSAPDNCCGGYKVTPSPPPPSSALPLRLTCRGMRQSRLPHATAHLHQNKVFVFFFSLQQQVFGLFFFFFFTIWPPPSSSNFRVASRKLPSARCTEPVPKKQFSKCTKYALALLWYNLLSSSEPRWSTLVAVSKHSQLRVLTRVEREREKSFQSNT